MCPTPLRYSRRMSIHRIMAALLAILIALASLSSSGPGAGGHIIRNGFLYGLPLILMGLLLAHVRWALMEIGRAHV